MKSKYLLKTCVTSFGIALGASLVAPQAHAYFEASVGISIHSTADFYTPLSEEGSWLYLNPYGRCWRPAGVAIDWRPYCNGYWEWTDCGWYWNSDDPWAWACYHYGSWADDPNYGWVWIPDTDWAPAWVNWREGDDCVGWAPCGPSGLQIDAGAFVFVREGHFHDRIRPDTVIVNDPQIIRQTTEIRGVRREDRDVDGRVQPVVVNNGPSVDAIEKSSGHRFHRVSVREAEDRTIQSAPERVRRSINSTVLQNSERQNGSPYAQPGSPAERLNGTRSSGRGETSSGYVQPDRSTERQNAAPNPNYLERQRQAVPQNGEPSYQQQRRSVQPQNQMRTPNPARPYQEVPQSSPGRNREMPQQFQPGSEIPQRSSVPGQAYPQSAPSERQIPAPRQEVPRYRGENPSREMMNPGQMGHPGIPAEQQVRPQSSVPQAPSVRKIPAPSQEVPRYRGENPSREMVSPGQIGHPGIPAGQQVRPQSPPVQVPASQPPDRGNGNDKKDHGQ